MSKIEILLTPALKQTYGGSDWDQDQNGNISFEEVKYKSDKELIGFLNAARVEPLALSFFRSLPLSRVAHLALSSVDSPLALEDRYWSLAFQIGDAWLASVCEAIFSSGGKDADEAVDFVLIGSHAVVSKENIWSLLKKKEYVSSRRELTIREEEEPPLTITAENINRLPWQEVSSHLLTKLSEGEDRVAAIYLFYQLSPNRQKDLLLRLFDNYAMAGVGCKLKEEALDFAEILESIRALFRSASTQLAFLLGSLYSESPEKFIPVLSALDDSILREGVLREDIVNDVAPELKGIVETELKERQEGKGYKDIRTVADYKNLVLKSRRPSLLVFGAEWCPPCQDLKPELGVWGRLFYQKADVFYIHIDKDKALEELLEKKFSKGGFGLPFIGIYHRGRFKRFDPYLSDDLRKALSCLISQ